MAPPITWRNIGSSVNPNAVARSGAYATNALNNALGGIQNTLAGIGQKKKDDALESFKNSLADMGTEQLSNVDLAGLSKSTGLGASQLQEMVNERIQTDRNQQLQDSKFAEFERGKRENPIIDGVRSKILGMNNRKDIDNFLQQSIEANPNLSEQAKAQIMSFGSIGDKVFNQNRQEEIFQSKKLKEQQAQEKNRLAGIQDANMNNFANELTSLGVNDLSYLNKFEDLPAFMSHVQNNFESYNKLKGKQKLAAIGLMTNYYANNSVKTNEELRAMQAKKAELDSQKELLKKANSSITKSSKTNTSGSLLDPETFKKFDRELAEYAKANGNENNDQSMNNWFGDTLAGSDLTDKVKILAKDGIDSKTLKEYGLEGVKEISGDELTPDLMMKAIKNKHQLKSDFNWGFANDTGVEEENLIPEIVRLVQENRNKKLQKSTNLDTLNTLNKLQAKGEIIEQDSVDFLKNLIINAGK